MGLIDCYTRTCASKDDVCPRVLEPVREFQLYIAETFSFTRDLDSCGALVPIVT